MPAVRLGVLGGTFDPPHLGHLHLALQARQQLGLEELLFVPAGQPPHKRDRPITPVAQRLVMLQRALDPYPAFIIDRSDIDRPPPHYTTDLLPLVQAQHPQARIWLIIGGDTLRDLLSWHKPETIVARWRIAVLPRPGADVDWGALSATLPDLRAQVDLLAGVQLDISSTAIRQMIAAGQRCDHMLPAGVDDYICRQGLYRAAS